MIVGRQDGRGGRGGRSSATPASPPRTRISRRSSTRSPPPVAGGCSRPAPRAKADRPGLRDALGYLREGDVLVVWKLDRLGRSLPHPIETVAALEGRGAGFRSLTEAVDTTTPGGRLVLHLFAALG